MQVFAIAPTVSRVPWLLLLPIGGVLIAAVVLTLSMLGMRQARFELSPEGLRLRGDLWGRTIARQDLVASEARRLDFDRSPDLRPTRRTMGTAMPGYQSGWFRLRNGERALVYLTDRTRAVYVPTRSGYSLLLSPSDPDAFVSAMHSLGARP